ncbi:MAG: MBL fold metallo-hydrolase [Patescibacteria group bacterium]|nr:MBL fold metallo-hydrolase [Patescibacteria group bacterium]
MVITYFGEGSFRVQSGEISVLVDPTSNRLKGDIILKTDAPVPGEGDELGAQTEITFPGEYESKGVEVTGVSLGVDGKNQRIHTAYLVRWEGITFAFLGSLGRVLDTELLEKLNEIDVVFLRLGNNYLTDEAAEKVVRQLEPKLVVPAYEKSPQAFLKEMGEDGALEDKFVFKKKDLDVIEGTKVIGLKAS